MIDFKEDKKPNTGELTKITKTAEKLIDVQRDIEALNDQLAVLEAQRDRISLEDLPTLMNNCGLSEFKLRDGSRVTIKPLVRASLPTDTAIMRCKDIEQRRILEDRRKHGLAYLRHNGAAALIKNLLRAEFGKDSERQAREALRILRELKVPAELVKTVHPQTLTAWVRERLEGGRPVDMDLLSVYSGSLATVERPDDI